MTWLRESNISIIKGFSGVEVFAKPALQGNFELSTKILQSEKGIFHILMVRTCDSPGNGICYADGERPTISIAAIAHPISSVLNNPRVCPTNRSTCKLDAGGNLESNSLYDMQE